MANQRTATMQDVARAAGVSRTAVSFVLSGRPDAAIPDETRNRIHAAAAELGYRPNAGARALASQRTRLFGLVTEIVTGPFAVETVAGAQHRALAAGQTLLIASSDGSPDADARAVETMLEHRVEGILYATGWHREVRLPAAVSECPTVLVHCVDADGVLPSIVPDEEQGGATATQRLLDLGHRGIALIQLDPQIKAAVGRRAGYEAALTAAGVPLDDDLVVVGDATAEGGYAAASALLDRSSSPTAFFCANDRMAMGAYDAIKERGLRIGPGDGEVAVVGFDNQDLIASHLRPTLTTVALPFAEMGALGVDTLSSTTRGGALPQHQVVGCSLVQRQSA